MRKTKIICTLGPATDQEAVLRGLIREGMDLARMNFSHGDHAEHLKRLQNLRRIAKEEGKTVAAMMDTRGPEIRTQKFANPPVQLVEGQRVVICREDVLGTAEAFSISYKHLHEDVTVGGKILIDDGLVALEVQSIQKETGDIVCVVSNGGLVSDHKSINVPGANIRLPSLTERDLEDLRFAVEQDMDFVAASFIRRPEDVLAIRKHLEQLGNQDIRIIAKIENREGIENFDKILYVSDAIMVARGDLGVEVQAHEVPFFQKQMIRQCYRFGKPAITATQMLDSMIRNPRPTRAEVSDVANAILDGTSAIMLSGETASGKYPLEAFRMMAQIAEESERNYDYWDFFRQSDQKVVASVGNAISHACCTTAMDIQAKAIVAMSISGRTARLISRFRPGCPILATACSEKITRQLALSWGVVPFQVDPLSSTDEVFSKGVEVARESGLVQEGDVVVITCGTPIGMSGTTNTLKVQTIGSVLCQGKSIGRGKVSKEVLNLEEDPVQWDEILKRRDQCILVAKRTDNQNLEVMRRAAGIVVEDSDPDSHSITVAKALDIPIIYDCSNATAILRSGTLVNMDLQTGMIS